MQRMFAEPAPQVIENNDAGAPDLQNGFHVAPNMGAAAAAAIPTTVEVPQVPPVPPNPTFAQWWVPQARGDQSPIYVNRLQYHRIEKRRESRRVLEAYYAKFAKKDGGSRPKYKSRVQHAVSRPRNKRGQYMNDKELEEYYREHPDKRPKVEPPESTTTEESLKPPPDVAIDNEIAKS